MSVLRRWVVNAYRCAKLTDDPAPIADAMLAGCKLSGVTVRQQCIERFQPHGLTLVLVLAESHFVVSTWPENRFCSLDLSICAEGIDLQQLVKPVIDLFQPAHISGQMIENSLLDETSVSSDFPVTDSRSQAST